MPGTIPVLFPSSVSPFLKNCTTIASSSSRTVITSPLRAHSVAHSCVSELPHWFPNSILPQACESQVGQYSVAIRRTNAYRIVRVAAFVLVEVALAARVCDADGNGESELVNADVPLMCTARDLCRTVRRPPAHPEFCDRLAVGRDVEVVAVEVEPRTGYRATKDASYRTVALRKWTKRTSVSAHKWLADNHKCDHRRRGLYFISR